MECNKDEAIRAKTIAEKKLSDKDYTGSKKFILKAQTLFPGLDGVSQMLTTLDVYISSENKVSGETDWYGILGVNPNDDDETIRKNYRKLALMLHPDKNKSIGADGAFKLLSEAWGLLSDKSKRAAYNQRRTMKVFKQNVQSYTGGPPPQNPPTAASRANGVKPFVRKPTSKSNNRSYSSTRVVPPVFRPPPPPPAVTKRADTFWTICHRCKMHYEYVNLYLNHTLICPNCQEPFLAKEMPPPASLPKSTSQQRPPNSFNNKNVHLDPSSRTSSLNTDPSIASKAASVIQQANDRLKREREEHYAGWPTKKRKPDDDNQISNGNLKGFPSISNSVNRTRELTYSETRIMLMKKARTEIRKKLSQWKSEEKSNENEESQTEDEAMNVPDPDFHDFDLDRTENSFEDNQVWAAYDDDDGMPRFYALIHKVLSRKPLKMKISWLNSKTTTEFGPFDWLGYGFQKTCGEFRIGKHEVNKSLNSFSQKVEWRKSPRGGVLIYPRKGQVWALYRNWARDWNENVRDEVIHKYDMVEVLEDYDEEKGVPVSPLVKFSGFKTVFYRHTYKNEVKIIKKEEMFRFSHQVPKYLLTGSEGHNCPKDCLELDPAATPLDLIQE